MNPAAAPTATLQPSKRDTRQVKERADLLALIPTTLRKRAGTCGGEYDGPCPKCGGDDRFHAQPHRPEGARWSCRQCHPQWSDVIEFCRWFHGDTLPQACDRIEGRVTTRAVPTPAKVTPIEQKKDRPYHPPWGACKVVARYKFYHPVTGKLVAEKERIEPGFNGARRSLWWRRPRPDVDNPQDGNPEHWFIGRGDTGPLLYNMPAVCEAIGRTPLSDEPTLQVFIFDGEKDVATATAAGLVACCSPDGWGSWPDFYSGMFIGVNVVIVPDHGEQGAQEHAHEIAQSIHRATWGTARIKVLPGVPALKGGE